jgi:hypothetical protein
MKHWLTEEIPRWYAIFAATVGTMGAVVIDRLVGA